MKKYQNNLHIPASILIIIQCFNFTACSANTDAEKIASSESELIKTVCKDPRPMICTNEYLPVCATREDGSEKTYATGCTACADKLVVAYRNNACEEN